MAIADTVDTLVPQRLKEGVTDAILDLYVAASIDTFSKLFPRKVVHEETVPSTNTAYEFSLPDDWEDSFSCIFSIEYPLGGNPPEYLDDESYQLYLDPNTNTHKLLFLDILPNKNFALTYTISWSLTTLSDRDSFSVALLTAALICDRLSAKYAGHTDEGFTADIVVFRDKSRQYESAKNNFLHLFAIRTGVDVRKLTVPAALEYGKAYKTTDVSGMFRDTLDG
jgi:hypothetical protein